MDITQSSNRVINRFPTLNNITPFTRVDGWSFLEVLEGLRNYIVNTLAPEIDSDKELITAQMNAWFDQYQLDNLELINEINSAKGGWQNAFDAFMADVVAQLEALNDQAAANLVNNELSLLKKALNGKFIKRHELLINVKDFGAKGDGVTDDLAAIEAAIAFAPVGATLFFPAGHYVTPSKARLDTGEGWTHITKQLHFLGQGNVKLQHFAFNVTGTSETLKPFAAAGFPGDEVVALSEANLSRGDLIQVFTAYNMYSPDSGEFQMGSANGVSSVLPLCRGAQMIPVVKASGNTVTLGQRLLYDFPLSAVGFVDPMPGVGNAEWRKIKPIKGMTIENIEFVHKDAGSAGSKNWNIRLTQDFTFKNCRWDLQSDLGGSTVVATDSYNFTFDNCQGTHSFSDISNGGSGANMILVGAGMTKVRVLNSRFERGSQIIDVITNDIPQNPNSQNAVTKSEYRSCNDILIKGNFFNGQVHSTTIHPATDGVMFVSNFVHDSGLGFHSRGRNTSIIGNYITSYLQGIGISAFSHYTTVSGNVLYQILAPNSKKHGWIGVQVSGMGSEVVTKNEILGMTIIGNTITARNNIFSCTGVNFSHTQAVLDAQTDERKMGRSDVDVVNNVLTNCTVDIGEFFAGIRVNHNTIRNTDPNMTKPLITAKYNSAACQFVGNILTNGFGKQFELAGRVNTGTLTRPYAAEHLIDKNEIVGTPNSTIEGALRPSYTAGETVQQGLTGDAGASTVGGVLNIAVVFPVPFVAAPRVILSALTHNSTVVPTGITTTGFTAQFKGNAVGASSNASYVAVGFTV